MVIVHSDDTVFDSITLASIVMVPSWWP